MDESAEIEFADKSPQIIFPFPGRGYGRTDCGGESVEGLAGADVGSFVEEGDRGGVPLSGDEGAGVEGFLTLRTIA